ncbi:MAG: hypothetical protein Q7J13_02785 [Brevundimonas sp.]|uniref:hypothetical protein n=1 Tax=Brevundimonas sp. TaxID=1871086 RepID=UPI0027216B1C|nr:hypothetical protein [Brevundimonas sp.]MDO9586836.1 hypothetical protein [Brevundimonas sp.]
MLIFYFLNAANGDELHVSRQHLSSDCGGGCCFDRAVEEFRQTILPSYVPGDDRIRIDVRGVSA